MRDSNLAFEAIGTHWQIAFERQNEKDIALQIHACIEDFDAKYSRFRDDSLIAKIAQHSGRFRLAADAEKIFNLYQDLYQVTNGAFTPFIGQALVDAGYDRVYSLQPKDEFRPLPRWDEVLDYHFPELVVKRPVQLDLGAAGKGYIIDLVGNLLRHAGCKDFCINAGGDILYFNDQNEPLKVALEHPAFSDQAIGVATILNRSICGSAANRRAWGKYHHIIDAKTLLSPRHILAVWVIASETILADALTTCLFFVEPELLASRYDFEYAIVYADYSLRHSSLFPGEFFIQSS